MRTLKTIGVISVAAVFFISAGTVFAQGRPANTLKSENSGRSNIESRAKVASTTQLRKENKEAARERMEAAREEAKERMEQQREKVAERVAEIKDKARQQKAERLAKQFEDLNEKWTDHFMNLLDRHDAIMQKIQNRATAAAAKGKDITSITAATQAANTAIASARTAVTAQAAKTYTPSVPATTTAATTTPAVQTELLKSLRDSFKNLHSALFKDLFALRDGAMKDARTAVQNALQTLKTIPGIDDDTATTTSNSNQ